MLDCVGDVLLGVLAAAARPPLGIGQPVVRERKRRVDGDRTLERVPCSHEVQVVQQRLALEVRLIGVQIRRGHVGHRLGTGDSVGRFAKVDANIAGDRVDHLRDALLAATLLARRVDILVRPCIHDLQIDRVQVTEATNRGNHQRVDSGRVADSLAERLVDPAHVGSTERLQDVEHARPRHHREAAGLFERRDQHAREPVERRFVGVVVEVDHRDWHAVLSVRLASPQEIVGDERRDEGQDRGRRERRDARAAGCSRDAASHARQVIERAPERDDQLIQTLVAIAGTFGQALLDDLYDVLREAHAESP